jgi:hypothetical protein
MVNINNSNELNKNLREEPLIEDLKASLNMSLIDTSEIMSQILEDINQIVDDSDTREKSLNLFNQLNIEITKVIQNIENQVFYTSTQYKPNEEE